MASNSGAVELEELDEEETLTVSKFCKCGHGDTVPRGCEKSAEEKTSASRFQIHSKPTLGRSPALLPLPTRILPGGEDNGILLQDTGCLKPASQKDCSASGYFHTSLAGPAQQNEAVFSAENGTVSLVDTQSESCALSWLRMPRVSLGWFSRLGSPSQPLSVSITDSLWTEAFPECLEAKSTETL